MSSESSVALGLISAELCNLALELGFISPEDYASTRKFSKETGADHYALLSQDQLIDEFKLVEALSNKYGIDCVQQFNYPELSEKFPKKYCIQNGLLPIQFDDEVIKVGIASPTSLNSLKNLGLMWGKKINAYFVPYSEFKNGLLELENPGYLSIKKAKVIHSTQDTSVSKNVQLVTGLEGSIATNNMTEVAALKNKKKSAEVVLSGDVIAGVNVILETAVTEKASDIHIEKYRDRARIRFRKNGALITPPQLQSFIEKNYLAVISRIKIIAGLDIAERRLPQDGGANFVSSKSKIDVDLRISIVPCSSGERAVLRILDKSSLSVGLDQLGFGPKQLLSFKRCIESPQGLVLVTGPTGSGKSTTLYGAINYLNKDDVNILTAEDPVEYSISGIGQVQMKDEIGLNFAAALRSFLRQDPEIILVGEIRDGETADIATKAALTGHLVLSTLHTNSAVGAITRLINMGLPKYLVSNALSCVVGQRLVRKTCSKCRVEMKSDKISEYKESPLFERIKGAKLFFGQGCEACNMTGFSSRFAVHEVLEIDSAIRGLINSGASESEIVAQAATKGYLSMMDRGLDFVLDGQTSFDELLRSIPMEA